MRSLRHGLAVLALTTAPALADDKAECSEGIAMIEAALAASPSEAARPKLATALRVAKRERDEGEFDECLDAVGDAKRALAR
ncbi:hypothetical protein ASG40_14090 [Methylobacterium sp. Leaf399]|uniref:hypothetical protein n=1 Tax=unclassified Methylobacterium TaxID=2615210 RepID=UPI0006F52D5B|nr:MULTISPECIES: hypothetical protein [unclassified Methylobacterium]KQT07457.1 hypothetical protein ASG40_14090 [Methylobacterium sp. Leaf399]KQT77317.1 hypothetical protein ASG59_12000 [Methylobacterium sp. Leaf466]